MLQAEQIAANYEKHLKIVDTYIGDRKDKVKELIEHIGETYIMAPASSKTWHHNAIPGGYVDHVNRVIEYSIKCKRLYEEMGFEVPLEELFSFIYKAPFDIGLTEHELDHVMVGYSETVPHINEDEVAAWKWMSMDAIANEMKEHPERYTEWFKIIFDRVFTYLKSNNETS